jgi:Tol biopolymer transport system component
MNSDGTSVTPFYNLSFNIPVASPNLPVTQYAFFYTSSLTNPVYNLYRNSTPTTTGAVLLTAPPLQGQPERPRNFRYVGTVQYLPNGSRIIFTASVAEGDFGVYSISTNGAGIDGTGIVRLGDAEEAFVNATGDKLAISRLVGGTADIGLLNIDGTGFVNLTLNSADDINPQWSKDGSTVYFASDRNGNFDIYSVPAIASSAATQLTSDARDEYGPSPNQSGTQIAFTVLSGAIENYGVYRVNFDGGGRLALHLSAGLRQTVFWTPIDGVDDFQQGGMMIGRPMIPRRR